MFKHVGQAGLPAGVVDRADIRISVKRDHGRFVAFEHDEVHSVRQRELGHPFLKIQ